jgi:hypothetical protein
LIVRLLTAAARLITVDAQIMHSLGGMLMKRCAILAVLILVNGRYAVAGISIGDFSGSESVIDFGNPTSPLIMPNPFALQGVTFQVGGGGFNVRIDDNSLLTDNIPGASLFGALETGLATAIVRIEVASRSFCKSVDCVEAGYLGSKVT